MKAKLIFLHIRGAHLRAEVIPNQKLVGHPLLEELPFEADLTAAANPGGENQLAIHITKSVRPLRLGRRPQRAMGRG